MTDKKIELFENYPVHKALITLALPTILGMLVNVFYNMVDTFFDVFGCIAKAVHQHAAAY